MFKNYLKTSLRFLSKNKTYSFINIFGLALGTLCCVYIILYVADQYSYDKQQTRSPKIFIVLVTTFDLPGDNHHNATTSPPIVPTMKKDFGEVMQYARLAPTLGRQQTSADL